jgi:endonuclease/exonuclease/phosphatase family metal-dependent hydrolase
MAVRNSTDRTVDDASITDGPRQSLSVATYNVHRWTGMRGGNKWAPELATAVIAELGADVVALQEVLLPFDASSPLEEIAAELGLYHTFARTRVHRRGHLGNAILSRWAMTNVLEIDLSFGRVEQRLAIAAQFDGNSHPLWVVSTHLGLVDRTRKRQVRSLLGHPRLQGQVVLLGDMNAWRRCPATRQLDREFTALHDNQNWPPSFPATRPVLALDRVYARGVNITELRVHHSPSARRGSDHLPVVATVSLDDAPAYNGNGTAY